MGVAATHSRTACFCFLVIICSYETAVDEKQVIIMKPRQGKPPTREKKNSLKVLHFHYFTGSLFESAFSSPRVIST
jgi:hypothetical protein